MEENVQPTTTRTGHQPTTPEHPTACWDGKQSMSAALHTPCATTAKTMTEPKSSPTAPVISMTMNGKLWKEGLVWSVSALCDFEWLSCGRELALKCQWPDASEFGLQWCGFQAWASLVVAMCVWPQQWCGCSQVAWPLPGRKLLLTEQRVSTGAQFTPSQKHIALWDSDCGFEIVCVSYENCDQCQLLHVTCLQCKRWDDPHCGRFSGPRAHNGMAAAAPTMVTNGWMEKPWLRWQLMCVFYVFRYRKVSGDSCQGGKDHQFAPDLIQCPGSGESPARSSNLPPPPPPLPPPVNKYIGPKENKDTVVGWILCPSHLYYHYVLSPLTARTWKETKQNIHMLIQTWSPACSLNNYSLCSALVLVPFIIIILIIVYSVRITLQPLGLNNCYFTVFVLLLKINNNTWCTKSVWSESQSFFGGREFVKNELKC